MWKRADEPRHITDPPARIEPMTTDALASEAKTPITAIINAVALLRTHHETTTN